MCGLEGLGDMHLCFLVWVFAWHDCMIAHLRVLDR